MARYWGKAGQQNEPDTLILYVALYRVIPEGNTEWCLLTPFF